MRGITQEDSRKNHLIGAINTTIRNVNKLCDREVINTEWKSVTMTNGEFQALLVVNGVDKMLTFPSEYWLTSSDMKEAYRKVIDFEIELTTDVD